MSTVQAVAGILLVFGLLALFYWMAYRFSGGRGFPGRCSKIEIVETRGIGDKRALLLVRVGSETFLVGSTTHQISLLSAIEPSPSPVEAAGPEPAHRSELAQIGGFAESGEEIGDHRGDSGTPLPRFLPRPSFRTFLEMFR